MGNGKKTDEHDKIYSQYENSGFKFNYNKRHLGKSTLIFQDEISNIDKSKHNLDLMFVNCQQCGAYMNFEAGLNALEGWWGCPTCGIRVKERTAYTRLDRENSNSITSNIFSYDDMPECCEACGGPWPDCEASCKIFED